MTPSEKEAAQVLWIEIYLSDLWAPPLPPPLERSTVSYRLIGDSMQGWQVPRGAYRLPWLDMVKELRRAS